MIPGSLDAAAYRGLADLHRPVDENGYAIAVLQLAAQGLRERDIAQHLRLDPGAVRRLLTTHHTENAR